MKPETVESFREKREKEREREREKERDGNGDMLLQGTGDVRKCE